MKASEKITEDCEARYRAMLSGFDGFVYISSKDYRIEFVNQNFIDHLGYDPTGELCHKALYNFDFPCPRCSHEKVLSGETVRTEIQNSKNEHWYSVVSTPVYYEDGRISNHTVLTDITDRKSADRALKDAHSIISKSAVVAFLWKNSAGWPVQFVTENVETLFGHSADDFMSGKIAYRAVVHPDDLERVGQEVSTFSADKDSEKFEHEPYRIVTKHGQIRWIADRTHIRRNANGEITHYQGIVEDITDRREVEEVLRITRFSIDQAAIGFLRIGEDARILDINEYVCGLLGYSRKELCRMSILDINTSLSDKGWSEFWQKMREKGVYAFESTYRRKDGSTVPVEITANHFKFQDHHFAITFVQDITERKKSEETLRLAQYSLDEASIGIYRIAQDSRILDVNETACKQIGYTREELCGMTVLDIDPEFNPPKWKEHREDLRAKGVKSIESKHRRKDGTVFPVEILINYHEFEGQAFSNSFVIDITERKKSQEEKENLQKQLLLAQKMEAVGQLAGGIAHDFNNLLQVIAGNAQLLLLNWDESWQGYNRLKNIERSSLKARELTRRLLTYCREIDSNLRPVNLNHEVAQIIAILERSLPKMIEIEFYPYDALYDINADSVQIEQILMNLAINAQHAMPDGGKLIIETKNVFLDRDYSKTHLGAREGEYAALVVSDNGIGMSPETLDRMYDPFFTTKKIGEGTGLGLSMVYGIVKNHGGSINCYSGPGQGTTFKIYFPATNIEPEPAAGEKPTDISAKGNWTETVLIVDDDLDVLELTQKMLTHNGYLVIAAVSGEEALELYKVHPKKIDLVILDLNMPGMGGTKCLEEILKFDPGAKVIIASGFSPNGKVRELLESCAGDFIGKPFDISDMLKKVRTNLDA